MAQVAIIGSLCDSDKHRDDLGQNAGKVQRALMLACERDKWTDRQTYKNQTVDYAYHAMDTLIIMKRPFSLNSTEAVSSQHPRNIWIT